MHCLPLEIFASERRYLHASSRAFMQVTTGVDCESSFLLPSRSS